MTRPSSSFLLRCGVAFGALGLVLPGVAFAGVAAVSPFVGKDVDPLVVLNMTSLVSSELMFMSDFDDVTQIEEMPSGMNSSCLGSTSCLSKVAKAAGADSLIAGAVAKKGSGFDMYLVLYDANRNSIVRKKDFTLPNTPSVIADSMGAYVKELVTGVSQKQEAAADSLGDFDNLDAVSLLDDDDDFVIDPTDTSVSRRISTPDGERRELSDDPLEDFDIDDGAAERERQAEEEAARRRAEEAEAKRRAEEAEAKRRAEEAEAKRRADEAEARRIAEQKREDERRRAAAAEEDDDEISFAPVGEDDLDISFGSAASLITVESAGDDDDGISFEDGELYSSSSRYDDDEVDPDDFNLDSDDGGRSSSSRERYESSRSSSSRTSTSRSSSRDDDDDDRSSRSSRSSDSSRYRDLEEDDRGSSSRSSSSRSSSERSEFAPADATLTGRLGYAPYQSLNFVTYGAELAYMATDHLAIVGGIEAYSVKRNIPEALLTEGESPEQWNTILPINAGLQGKFGGGTAQPYVGADLVLIPGYVKDTGGVALGGRARLGLDILVSDGFGFNLNAAVGMLSGENFSAVADGVDESGLNGQLSGGTVFRF